MAKEKPLKSAYELAMARLQADDRKQGVVERKPLTRSQKKRIAELRQEARAKLAELEILRDERLAGAAGDPEKLKEEEEHYKTDRRRVESRLNSAIAEAKDGASSS